MTTEKDNNENLPSEDSPSVASVMTLDNITGAGEDVGALDYSPPPKGVYVEKYSPIFHPKITKP
jgi:hypothetical protein